MTTGYHPVLAETAIAEMHPDPAPDAATQRIESDREGVACETCGGSGEAIDPFGTLPCPTCSGTGRKL